MSGGIENQILSDIENATGTSWDDVDVDLGTDADDPSPSQPETPGPDQPGVEDDQQDRSLQKQRADRQTKPQEAKPPNVRIDQKGNVVDEKGNVIARAGAERRLHQQNTRLTDVNNTLEREVTRLRTEVQRAQQFAELPTKLGLSQDDVAEAFAIASSFKKNPVQAAREVISRALASGAELRQIVDDEFIPNLSMAATKQMLDERLKAQQPKQDTDNGPDTGALEAQRFLARNPDAEVHSDVVASMMGQIRQEYESQGRSIDVRAAADLAWTRLREFCFRNNLDVTQPLEPQIKAVEAARSGQKAPNGQGVKPSTRRPMPNGTGRGSVTEQRQTYADASDDWGSIVRQSMRENGININ